MTHHTFSIREVLRFGWMKTKEHAWFIFLAAVAAGVLLVAASHFPFVNIIVGLLVGIAFIRISLSITEGHKPTFEDIVRPFRTVHITWHYFVASVICGILLVGAIIPGCIIFGVMFYSLLIKNAMNDVAAVIFPVGFLLTVIPALYVGVRLQFYKYITVDQPHMTGKDSIKESWKITHGHFWKLLGYVLVVIIMNIIGALLIGIGLLITVPITVISTAALYNKLKLRPLE